MTHEEELELIKRLVAECHEYSLAGAAKLSGFSLDQLVEIYNGTGPEWMRDDTRELLDAISKDLLAAVLIHDVEFKIGGSKAAFFSANDRLRFNCIMLAKAKYGWWRPRRYRLISQAKLFAASCDIFGWAAFNFEQGAT